MSTGPALVPGELRGFRQFRLLGDGLHPVARTDAGPWDGGLEQARCLAGHDHAPPAADCRCGLYAWYRPGSPEGWYGGVHAVVAARGRTVLADRGFRAASARVVAVALPATHRLRPDLDEHDRAVLAAHYPQARVYRSARRMWADHPADDVTALGIVPAADLARRWWRIALAVWATFVLPCYALLLLPREDLAAGARTWWPLLLVVFVAWQALLVLSFTRGSRRTE